MHVGGAARAIVECSAQGRTADALRAARQQSQEVDEVIRDGKKKTKGAAIKNEKMTKLEAR
jgi:hypothetical protein